MRTLAALVLLASAAAAAPPNVLIVMTDDQGLGDFSYTGNPVLKTPHFDAFAKQAVRLTDFHVAPMCSPTRGQLMTGLAAVRNGATSVTAGRTFLRPGLPTMADVFAKAGYRTGLFGKWHLGDLYPHRPIDKGFHESVYHLGWGMLHATPEIDNPLFDGRYFHNGEPKKFAGHCTDFWFDRAQAFMGECQRKSQPFLCYLPTNAPHAPFIDRDEYIAPYKGKGPAGFFGMIAHLDERFGRLDKFLTDSGLAADTIVIFMTDNGGTAGVKTHNAGLRAGKTTYYDGGHRVPCWVRWPNGNLGEPRDVAAATQNVDLLPTLVDLCGIRLAGVPAVPAKEHALFGGVSLAGLLRGTVDNLADRMFVVQYGQVVKKFECCVLWNNWRLVKGEELYNVAADRAQEKNVAVANPGVVKAMRDYYEGWWAAVEPWVGEFVPNHIGAKQQPVVELTSADWEGIYADNVGYVRAAAGGPTGGHWHIQVEAAGEYSFTLRRWPEQSGTPLGGIFSPSEKSPGNGKYELKGFPAIRQARLEIAGRVAEVAADPQAGGATVVAKLPAGRTTLKAYFRDADGKPLCGAFFVRVKKTN